MAASKKDENSPSDLLEMPGVETKAVALEAKAVEPTSPEKQPEVLPKKVKEPVVKELIPRDFYNGLGVPVCPKCGSKKQTDENGIICVIGSKECPLIG